MLYSKSTNGFYDRAIHGNNVPPDVVEITDAEHAALLSGQAAGKIITADATGRPTLIDPPPPTPEHLWARYSVAMQYRLDAFALTRGYDSGALCASYKGDPDPKWDSEATCYISKRSQTWKKFYSIQDAVSAGTREMPTLDDLLLELPVLTWDTNG